MSLKNRNIALFIGMLLLLWVSYNLSFSKTISLRKQYHTLLNEKEYYDNVSQKFLNLKQQRHYYDSILRSKQITDIHSFQNNLLQIITSYSEAKGLKIIHFSNPHEFKTDNANIRTYTFTLKGTFKSINQLIYELEQHHKFGKIISVQFEKKKNFITNTQQLECVILLQQIDTP